MSLAVYARARAVYAANSAAANDRAAAVAHDACAAYGEARQQYSEVAARYDAHVTHVLPPPDDLEAMHDLSTYTSSRAPDMLAYYDTLPRRPDTRAIDAELRRRAEQRRHADVQAATAHALEQQASDTPTTLLQRRRAAAQSRLPRMCAQLLQRQADEYADLCDIEQAHFRVLARTYYDTVFGAIDELAWCETRGRQVLVDMEASASLDVLARLGHEIAECEQGIIRRGMGLETASTQRRRREALEAAAAAERAAHVLDSMHAVPLMQRTLAIRQETLNEEDMTFRHLRLAFDVQADLIAEGYVRYNAHNGLLERNTSVPVPLRKREVVATAFRFAHLCLELQEESARMCLVDAAVDEEAALYAALAQQLTASYAAAEARRLPWKRLALTNKTA